VVCYSLSPRLAALVGVEPLGHQSSEYPGQFARMRFLPGGPPGLPDEAKQDSWNIEKVRPAATGARVIAEWMDTSGKDTCYPAVILSDTGAYISHVLLDVLAMRRWNHPDRRLSTIWCCTGGSASPARPEIDPTYA